MKLKNANYLNQLPENMLLEKRKIVLVDEDVVKRQVFLSALDKVSTMFNCTFYSNKRPTLKALKEISPDYIFVDISVPDEKRLQLIKAIRNERRLCHIPVYLYAEEVDRHLAQVANQYSSSKCIRTPKSDRMLIRLFTKLFYQHKRAELRNFAPRCSE